MKSGTFHKKYVKSIEKIWKATKTANSTQVSHFDLVFHRVQREGQLGICYILVIFGGICVMCAMREDDVSPWWQYASEDVDLIQMEQCSQAPTERRTVLWRRRVE